MSLFDESWSHMVNLTYLKLAYIICVYSLLQRCLLIYISLTFTSDFYVGNFLFLLCSVVVVVVVCCPLSFYCACTLFHFARGVSAGATLGPSVFIQSSKAEALGRP